MAQGARTTATLLGLALLVVLGATWGWSAMTAPFPGKASAPICEQRSVAAGDKVYPSEVVVSVLNSGSRLGLAGRTMALFMDQGFVMGDATNAPTKSTVKRAAIWTSDPKNPAVKLVASRLPGARIQVKKSSKYGAGVVVVVGDGFSKLLKGKDKVTAKTATTICSPPVD